MHKSIQIKNLTLSFPHKICFDDFSTQVHYGSRIAIIGRNGSGKSSLLKILQGISKATQGDVHIPEDVILGYVPQIIAEFDTLSGGQRLNAAVTAALKNDPNVLLLDEPTNHLDHHNRKSLIRMLRNYVGTLIVVSHDTEILRHCIDTLWHIDNGKIHVFTGNFDDYMREIHMKRVAIEKELSKLNRQKKDMHQALMKEQKRAAKSRAKGEKSIKQKKWPTVVSHAKALQSEETSGRKKMAIDHKKRDLTEQLSNLRLPEIIVPTFHLSSADNKNRTVVSISGGTIGYQAGKPVLSNIHLSLNFNGRLAIRGDNGSGKSTLAKAILGDHTLIKTGDWYTLKAEEIGYLDQHYSTLSPEKTVFESIAELVPSWSHLEVRRHLTDFLFRKNEEVNTSVGKLSGGEKARLSLAKIAAKTPRLLILDEITNNLDAETREHVIHVLKNYPGAMIVISHDEYFLRDIGIDEIYKTGE